MSGANEIPPQPLPDEDSAGFWAATAEGHLAICRCSGCRRWIHPPLDRCPRCWSTTAYEPVSGRGSLFSYIVVHQPAVPGYREQVPYPVALVELEEQAGLRLPGRLVGFDAKAPEIGCALQAELEPLPGGDYHVAVFRPR